MANKQWLLGKSCTNCVNRRLIISENGLHAVCGLSAAAARNCILGKKDHFVLRWKVEFIDDDGRKTDAK